MHAGAILADMWVVREAKGSLQPVAEHWAGQVLACAAMQKEGFLGRERRGPCEQVLRKEAAEESRDVISEFW